MTDKVDVNTIKAQAARVQKECPELFDYLVCRDEATGELVRGLIRSIPNPGDIPKLKIPFEDLVVELLAPSDDCPVCDEDGDSLFLLNPEIRARLCDICRHGVYLTKTGIGPLTT
jgi:hypothetical protein